MRGPRWRADKFDTSDKWIGVHGPNDFYLRVDYDDVDHPTVRVMLERVLEVLNEVKEWPDRVESDDEDDFDGQED